MNIQWYTNSPSLLGLLVSTNIIINKAKQADNINIHIYNIIHTETKVSGHLESYAIFSKSICV